LNLLSDLSDLALSLLISAARLTIIHETESLNFALAYAEYVSLASKARINSAASGQLAAGGGARLFGKDVAKKEWDGLVELGFLVSVGAGAFGLGGVRGGGSGKEGEMFRVDVALEEIPGGVAMDGGSLSAVMEKWCKQI
jgi:origin recognition complex subunit 4